MTEKSLSPTMRAKMPTHPVSQSGVNSDLVRLDPARLADPQATCEYERQCVLKLLMASTPGMMGALRGIRSIGLRDWCVSGRTLTYVVYSSLLGAPAHQTRMPLSVLCYEPEPAALGVEPKVIQNLRRVVMDERFDLQIVNVAKERSQLVGNIVSCVDEAVLYSPLKALAAGVRLGADGSLNCVAPFGLTSLFKADLAPNPFGQNDTLYLREVNLFQRLWPAGFTC